MFSLLLILLNLGITVFGRPTLRGLKRDAWSDQVVSLHNSYRAQYGANPVDWDQSLYSDALSWAQRCKFEHKRPEPGHSIDYGENLYTETGNDAILPAAMKSWMNEASKYNYNNPGFSSATGHFTQVVWKSTTGVACAQADCAAETIFQQASKFLVCRYSPPGNYAGQFESNVGRRV